MLHMMMGRNLWIWGQGVAMEVRTLLAWDQEVDQDQ